MKREKIWKVLQWYIKNSGLHSSQTINEMTDTKNVRYKSPINRAIVIINVVIMVNTKHLGKNWKAFNGSN